MLLLLSLALLLSVLTLWWITRPFWRPVKAVASSERADLLQLRDRLLNQLNELDVERADRGMDASVATQEEARLSAELAAVLKQLETDSPQSPPATSAVSVTRGWSWRATLAVSAVVMVLGAGLYAWMNAGNLQGYWLAAESGASGTQVPPMVFEMVKRLEKKLAENPNDAAGWARLGRSYAVMGRKDKALEAFARSYAITPDNVEMLSEYAWTLFNGNEQITTGLVNELYTRLNRLQPEHPDSLWFLGLAAAQGGDTRKALVYWERLLKLIPPQDPGRAQLQKIIQEARSRARR